MFTHVQGNSYGERVNSDIDLSAQTLPSVPSNQPTVDVSGAEYNLSELSFSSLDVVSNATAQQSYSFPEAILPNFSVVDAAELMSDIVSFEAVVDSSLAVAGAAILATMPLAALSSSVGSIINGEESFSVDYSQDQAVEIDYSATEESFETSYAQAA